VLWAEGEGIMITGHQGVGKTIVAQQVVLHRIGLRAGDSCGSR
jgi:DNA-binding NtrC family response regulator